MRKKVSLEHPQSSLEHANQVIDLAFWREIQPEYELRQLLFGPEAGSCVDYYFKAKESTERAEKEINEHRRRQQKKIFYRKADKNS